MNDSIFILDEMASKFNPKFVSFKNIKNSIFSAFLMIVKNGQFIRDQLLDGQLQRTHPCNSRIRTWLSINHNSTSTAGHYSIVVSYFSISSSITCYVCLESEQITSQFDVWYLHSSSFGHINNNLRPQLPHWFFLFYFIRSFFQQKLRWKSKPPLSLGKSSISWIKISNLAIFRLVGRISSTFKCRK